MSKVRKSLPQLKLPPAHDWRTTDADELNKRRQRAREESFEISNATPSHPVFSNFRIKSGSGLTYAVEIRDLAGRQFACDCVDFRTNGLGSCKHVEAVLLHVEARNKRLFKRAQLSEASDRIDLVVDGKADTLRIATGLDKLSSGVRASFRANGQLMNRSPEAVVELLQQLRDDGHPEIRISQEVAPWLENRRRAVERTDLRHKYELKTQSGEWPASETTVPLFPYQRDGMLHLAFTERALLADEMGLGKTIQAIAACALLHRLGRAKRVLVVTPASLKTEWEEQIRRFTTLSYRLVFGGRIARLQMYSAEPQTPFFTIVNYEQMVGDALDVNKRLAPDVVVLDEAQRIKNWNTKTAQAVKRLHSRYAFVLTGTPIENRIDDLRSLMDFLNPNVLGPLFRFNRDFYQLDERGRPEGFCNLDVLHQRIKPYMLRRRKAEVETELPDRIDRNHFVPLSSLQKQAYEEHALNVSKLAHLARRRMLTPQQKDKLMRELAMMRMTCDTNYILDSKDRTCPKLAELEKVLEECVANDAKVIIFSEWERMLELVRELCRDLGIGYAWHTGTVPQKRRRAEINAFKNYPQCRVFLSTDAGATGLNLQNASVVVNCDLPWNPAKLEQRIARAWRKHQVNRVTVVNLISENTIEAKMLETLATKQSMASSVLDNLGAVKEIKLRSGHDSLVKRLDQLIAPSGVGAPKPGAQTKPPPADPAVAFSELVVERLGAALVQCEERYPETGPHSVLVVVVDREPAQWRESLRTIHEDLLASGKVDPLAPVQLEVIDRATDEAIQRLIAAGLIARTTRASRSLLPAVAEEAPLPLSPAEHARAKEHKDRAARKLKMARVLGSSGFDDEARPALVEAIHAVGGAMAVERRLPEPRNFQEVLQAPLAHGWGEFAPTLRMFFEGAGGLDWKPVAERLGGFLGEACLPGARLS